MKKYSGTIDGSTKIQETVEKMMPSMGSLMKQVVADTMKEYKASVSQIEKAGEQVGKEVAKTMTDGMSKGLKQGAKDVQKQIEAGVSSVQKEINASVKKIELPNFQFDTKSVKKKTQDSLMGDLEKYINVTNKEIDKLFQNASKYSSSRRGGYNLRSLAQVINNGLGVALSSEEEGRAVADAQRIKNQAKSVKGKKTGSMRLDRLEQLAIQREQLLLAREKEYEEYLASRKGYQSVEALTGATRRGTVRKDVPETYNPNSALKELSILNRNVQRENYIKKIQEEVAEKLGVTFQDIPLIDDKTSEQLVAEYQEKLVDFFNKPLQELDNLDNVGKRQFNSAIKEVKNVADAVAQKGGATVSAAIKKVEEDWQDRIETVKQKTVEEKNNSSYGNVFDEYVFMESAGKKVLITKEEALKRVEKASKSRHYASSIASTSQGSVRTDLPKALSEVFGNYASYRARGGEPLANIEQDLELFRNRDGIFFENKRSQRIQALMEQVALGIEGELNYQNAKNELSEEAFEAYKEYVKNIQVANSRVKQYPDYLQNFMKRSIKQNEAFDILSSIQQGKEGDTINQNVLNDLAMKYLVPRQGKNPKNYNATTKLFEDAIASALGIKSGMVVDEQGNQTFSKPVALVKDLEKQVTDYLALEKKKVQQEKQEQKEQKIANTSDKKETATKTETVTQSEKKETTEKVKETKKSKQTPIEKFQEYIKDLDKQTQDMLSDIFNKASGNSDSQAKNALKGIQQLISLANAMQESNIEEIMKSMSQAAKILRPERVLGFSKEMMGINASEDDTALFKKLRQLDAKTYEENRKKLSTEKLEFPSTKNIKINERGVIDTAYDIENAIASFVENFTEEMEKEGKQEIFTKENLQNVAMSLVTSLTAEQPNMGQLYKDFVGDTYKEYGEAIDSLVSKVFASGFKSSRNNSLQLIRGLNPEWFDQTKVLYDMQNGTKEEAQTNASTKANEEEKSQTVANTEAKEKETEAKEESVAVTKESTQKEKESVQATEEVINAKEENAAAIREETAQRKILSKEQKDAIISQVQEKTGLDLQGALSRKDSREALENALDKYINKEIDSWELGSVLANNKAFQRLNTFEGAFGGNPYYDYLSKNVPPGVINSTELAKEYPDSMWKKIKRFIGTKYFSKEGRGLDVFAQEYGEGLGISEDAYTSNEIMEHLLENLGFYKNPKNLTARQLSKSQIGFPDLSDLYGEHGSGFVTQQEFEENIGQVFKEAIEKTLSAAIPTKEQLNASVENATQGVDSEVINGYIQSFFNYLSLEKEDLEKMLQDNVNGSSIKDLMVNMMGRMISQEFDIKSDSVKMADMLYNAESGKFWQDAGWKKEELVDLISTVGKIIAADHKGSATSSVSEKTPISEKTSEEVLEDFYEHNARYLEQFGINIENINEAIESQHLNESPKKKQVLDYKYDRDLNLITRKYGLGTGQTMITQSATDEEGRPTGEEEVSYFDDNYETLIKNAVKETERLIGLESQLTQEQAKNNLQDKKKVEILSDQIALSRERIAGYNADAETMAKYSEGKFTYEDYQNQIEDKTREAKLKARIQENATVQRLNKAEIKAEKQRMTEVVKAEKRIIEAINQRTKLNKELINERSSSSPNTDAIRILTNQVVELDKIIINTMKDRDKLISESKTGALSTSDSNQRIQKATIQQSNAVRLKEIRTQQQLEKKEEEKRQREEEKQYNANLRELGKAERKLLSTREKKERAEQDLSLERMRPDSQIDKGKIRTLTGEVQRLTNEEQKALDIYNELLDKANDVDRQISEKRIEEGTQNIRGKNANVSAGRRISIQEKTEQDRQRFEGLKAERASKFNKDLTAIKSSHEGYASLSEYENVVQNIKKLNETTTLEDFEKQVLKVNDAFNTLNAKITEIRGNLKGANTLSTEISAEKRIENAKKSLEEYRKLLSDKGFTDISIDKFLKPLSDIMSEITQQQNAKNIEGVSLLTSSMDSTLANTKKSVEEAVGRVKQQESLLQKKLQIETSKDRDSILNKNKLNTIQENIAKNDTYFEGQKLENPALEQKKTTNENLANQVNSLKEADALVQQLAKDYRQLYNVQAQLKQTSDPVNKKGLELIQAETQTRINEAEARLREFEKEGITPSKEALNKAKIEGDNLLNKTDAKNNIREQKLAYDELIANIREAIDLQSRFNKAQVDGKVGPETLANYQEEANKAVEKVLNSFSKSKNFDNYTDFVNKIFAEGVINEKQFADFESLNADFVRGKTQKDINYEETARFNQEQAASNAQQKQDTKELIDLMNRYAASLKRVQQMQKASGNIDGLIQSFRIAQELKEQLDAAQQSYSQTYGQDAAFEAYNKSRLSAFNGEDSFAGAIGIQDSYLSQIDSFVDKLQGNGTVMSSLRESAASLRQEITNLTTAYLQGEITLQQYEQSLNNFKQSFNQAMGGMKNVNSTFGDIEKRIDGMLDTSGNKIGLWTEQLTAFKESVGNLYTDYTKGNISQEDAMAELNNIFQAIQGMQRNQGSYLMENTKGTLITSTIGDVNDLSSATKAVTEYAKAMNLGTKVAGSIKKSMDGKSVSMMFKDEEGNLTKVVANIEQIGEAGKRSATGIRILKTEAGQAGSFLDKMGSTVMSIGKSFAFYFSGYRMVMQTISALKQGFNTFKEYQDSLVNISYTMDITKQQLESMGQSAIEMSQDLGMSIQNASQIYKIYANMQTTPEQIAITAKPTAILSNLTGVDASTAADQIQGILQQFSLLDEEGNNAAEASMHVVDVLDKISSNVAMDYSRGISTITQAVTQAGAVAYDAGMSYEQLAAISAKVAERTREDGSSIGNAIKTIATRLSKVGKMPDYAEEVSNEDLSNASKSLHKVGIEVYNADGSYRELDVILGELKDKWDGLTDAQKANISFNIAATRQTAKFKNILEAWTGSMNLAEEATVSSGNALENQEKYEESVSGRMEKMKAQGGEFWINLFNSDVTTGAIDGLTTLISLLNELSDVIGSFPTFVISLTGIIAGFTALKAGVSTFIGLIADAGGLIPALGSVGAMLPELIIPIMAIVTMAGFAKAVYDAAHANDILIQKGEKANETIKNAVEGYKSLEQKINSISKTYSDQEFFDSKASNQAQNDIESLTEKYYELQKGVGKNNENLSLSDEDYQTYLDISNQLAEMFPTIRNGSDDAGNALLDMGNNASEASSKLQELLETERAIANLDISKNLVDSFEGAKASYRENEEEREKINNQIKNKKSDSYDLTFSGIQKVPKNYMESLKKLVEDSDSMNWWTLATSFQQAQKYNTGEMEYSIDFDALKRSLSNEEWNNFVKEANVEVARIQRENAIEVNNLEGQLSVLDSQDKNTWYQQLDYIKSYLETEATFNEMDSTLAQGILDNLKENPLFSQKALLEDNSEDALQGDRLEGYLYANLIDPISALEQPAQKALAKALTLDTNTLSYSSYESEINKLLEIAFPEDKASQDQWKKQLGLDNMLDSYEETFQSASKKVDGLENDLKNLSKEDLELVANMDTDEPIKTIAELKTKIEELRKESSEPIPVTIEEAITQDNSTFKSAQEAQESANSGATYDTMYSMYQTAKELVEKGDIGTDDFQKIAAMFSPSGAKDLENWNENLGKINKYFTEDNSGIRAFLKDLESKGYADFDESTKTWALNFEDMEKAAKDMGIGYEPFLAILGELKDKGFTNDFFADAESGGQLLGDLTNQLYEAQKELDYLQTYDKSNDTAIQAKKDEIESLEERIKSTSESLDELLNKDPEETVTKKQGARKKMQERLKAFNKTSKQYTDGEGKQAMKSYGEAVVQALQKEGFINAGLREGKDGAWKIDLDINTKDFETKSKYKDVEKGGKKDRDYYNKNKDLMTEDERETYKRDWINKQKEKGNEKAGETIRGNLAKDAENRNKEIIGQYLDLYKSGKNYGEMQDELTQKAKEQGTTLDEWVKKYAGDDAFKDYQDIIEGRSDWETLAESAGESYDASVNAMDKLTDANNNLIMDLNNLRGSVDALNETLGGNPPEEKDRERDSNRRLPENGESGGESSGKKKKKKKKPKVQDQETADEHQEAREEYEKREKKKKKKNSNKPQDNPLTPDIDESKPKKNKFKGGGASHSFGGFMGGGGYRSFGGFTGGGASHPFGGFMGGGASHSFGGFTGGGASHPFGGSSRDTNNTSGKNTGNGKKAGFNLLAGLSSIADLLFPTVHANAAEINPEHNLDDSINAYCEELDRAKEANVDFSKTVYGNIDTDNRQKLYWTDENKERFGSAASSWGINTNQFGSQDYSTVLGMWGNFGQEGIPIAFTPMLQTENGTPELLNQNTVYDYIDNIVAGATEDGQINPLKLFDLDAEGMDIDGQHISNLIAGIGDEADLISQQMHFSGTSGSIFGIAEGIQQELDASGISLDEFLQTYGDKIPDELKKALTEAKFGENGNGGFEVEMDVDQKKVEKKLKKLKKGETMEITADVEGVEQEIEAVIDEEGNIHYYTNINEVRTEVEPVVNEDGSVTYKPITDDLPEEMPPIDQDVNQQAVPDDSVTTPPDPVTQDVTRRIVNETKQANSDGAPKSTTVTANTKGADKVAALQGAISSVQGKQETVEAKAKGEPQVRNLASAIKTVQSKAVNVSASLTGTSAATFNALATSIKNLPLSKTSRVITKYVTKRVTELEGTAHSSGTAFAKGSLSDDQTNSIVRSNSWKTSKAMDALTGEVGQELVVTGNRWFTVGDNGAEFAHIPKGAVVFNAEQTEQLFSKGYINSRGKVNGQLRYPSSSATFLDGSIDDELDGLDEIDSLDAFLTGHAFGGLGGAKGSDPGSDSSNKSSSKSSTSKKSSNNKSSNNKSSKKKSSKKKGKSAWDKFEDWLSKFFDWMEIRLDRLGRKTEKWQDAAENAITLNGKVTRNLAGVKYTTDGMQNNTQKAIQATKKEYNASNKAEDLYFNQAKKVQKRALKLKKKGKPLFNKKKLKKAYKQLKQGKKVNIAEYGEKYRSVLEEMQNWIEKGLDQEQKTIDLQQQLADLYKQRFENIQTWYDTVRDFYSSQASSNESFINLRKATGEKLNRDAYKYQLSSLENTSSQSLKEYTAYLKEFNAQFAAGRLKKGTLPYYEAKAELEKLEQQYYDDKEAIASLRHEMDMLDLENLQKGIDLVSAVFERMSNLSDAIKDIGDTNWNTQYGELQSYYKIEAERTKEEYDGILEKRESILKKMATVEVNSDSWIDFKEQLDSADSDLISILTRLKTISDNNREMNWEPFNRGIETIKHYKDELNTLQDALNEDNFLADNGTFTNEGLANIALMLEQIELGQSIIANNREALKKLDEEYENGVISKKEWTDQTREFCDEIANESNAISNLKDNILDAYIDSLEKQNSLLQENIDKRKDALSKVKDYYDYQRTISEKSKDINYLQQQIAALDGVSNKAAQAKLASLREELAEAQLDMNDTVYEHEYDLRTEGLDSLSEDIDKALDRLIEELNRNNEKRDSLIENLATPIGENASSINNLLQGVISEQGLQLEITSASDLLGNTLISEQGIANLKTLSSDILSFAEFQKNSNLSGASETLTQIASLDTKAIYDNIGGIAELYNEIINKTGNNTDYSDVGKEVTNTALPGTNEKTSSSNKSATKTTTKTTKTTSYTKEQKANYKTRIDGYLARNGKKYNKTTKYGELNTALGKKTGFVLDEKHRTDLAKHLGTTEKNLYKFLQDIGYLPRKTTVSGKFAKGTKKVPKDMLGITQDAGQEVIFRKSDGAMLTPLGKGDKVFTAQMTDNLWKLAQNASLNNNGLSELSAPIINNVNTSSPTININFENFMNVEGNVDENAITDIRKFKSEMVDEFTKTMTNEMNLLGHKFRF